MIFNKITMYIKKPGNIILYLMSKGFFNFLSDEKYLKLKYRIIFGKRLDLNNPKTFNEKLQWLKLYDRKDLYTKLVDKYEVKKYVANIIGSECIIPTIGVYDNFDEIDFNCLPNQFVIKCTHDSGGLVIVKDKNKLDIKSARRKINKSLKKNFYYLGREWPYKNVKPRIIIEKYMEDSNLDDLRDYKFFCFHGVPKFMFVATDRQIGKTKFNFYDLNFKLLPFVQGHPNDMRKIEKPVSFNKMVEYAKKLSQDIPHVRVDFYEIGEKVYFGEMTFYHYSGFTSINPEEWDEKLGSYIILPKKNSKDDER